MKAIVLAAGEGTRLRPLTEDRPKCLVEFRCRPILDYILEALRGAGVEDITVVTGYQADRIEAMDVRTRHNAEFASTNMVQSLFCARDQMDDDLIVSYADIVYSKAVVEKLMASGGDFSVVIDHDWRSLWSLRMEDPLADAESLKLDSRGNICELGKKPNGYSDIEGQYIGLFRIAKKALAPVLDFYDGLDRDASYDGKDFANMYMTSFIQAVVDRVMPVQAVPINGGWLEIDSLTDLEAYEQHLEYFSSWLEKT